MLDVFGLCGSPGSSVLVAQCELASEDGELDIVVFGATGFVRRLVAGYLVGRAPGGVRVGLAGGPGDAGTAAALGQGPSEIACALRWTPTSCPTAPTS
jgi:hypothetical protein